MIQKIIFIILAIIILSGFVAGVSHVISIYSGRYMFKRLFQEAWASIVLFPFIYWAFRYLFG